jgi:glycosyltransferase involved in cell wall biosynthesis
MDSRALVSIVVPTRNSEHTIKRCLDSIRAQSYKYTELIVADECSSDRTVEIARAYSRLVYVSESIERAAQKNVGIKKARGEFICFIDSDMELMPTVIEECVERIDREERVGGVIIPERSIGPSFWVKVRDFERSFYAGSVVESARFFRRDLVVQVGGFDEDLIFFEESVLPQKIENIGYSARARIESEILHHEDDFSLWRHLRKRYYYGKTTRGYQQRNPDYYKKQYGLWYRLKLFVANDRFVRRPVFGLSVLLLKTLELCFNELGAFSSRLARNERPQ